MKSAAFLLMAMALTACNSGSPGGNGRDDAGNQSGGGGTSTSGSSRVGGSGGNGGTIATDGPAQGGQGGAGGTSATDGPTPGDQGGGDTTDAGSYSDLAIPDMDGADGVPLDDGASTDCDLANDAEALADALSTSPDAAAPSCPGANPAARTCRSTTSDCIPSSCYCADDGQWRCTSDCRGYALCDPDGGTSDAKGTCSGARIDNAHATAAFAQYIKQINPGLNPATIFGAEEKAVANLWDVMQAQLFLGKMYGEDGLVWQEAAFLYRACAVTLPTGSTLFGLLDSGVVANGAFYYSWASGSGVYRSTLGKLAPDGATLVETTSPAYFNPGSGPPGLVFSLEGGRLVVYRATVYWEKFNEWLNPEPMGFLKDYGDRLAVVDENGKELSTTLP